MKKRIVLVVVVKVCCDFAFAAIIHIQNICDLIKFDSHIEGDPCAGQIVLTNPKVKVTNQVYRLSFI